MNLFYNVTRRAPIRFHEYGSLFWLGNDTVFRYCNIVLAHYHSIVVLLIYCYCTVYGSRFIIDHTTVPRNRVGVTVLQYIDSETRVP